VCQFWKGISAGPALKYFTWFPSRCGRLWNAGFICTKDDPTPKFRSFLGRFWGVVPNFHRCRRFGRLALTDWSVGHGRYWRSVRFHLRDNTVDIDGRFGYTYGELRWILTVGSVPSTQKLVDIDHIGRFIPKKIGRRSISTVKVDIHSKKLKKSVDIEFAYPYFTMSTDENNCLSHTLKKTQKKCWYRIYVPILHNVNRWKQLSFAITGTSSQISIPPKHFQSHGHGTSQPLSLELHGWYRQWINKFQAHTIWHSEPR